MSRRARCRDGFEGLAPGRQVVGPEARCAVPPSGFYPQRRHRL